METVLRKKGIWGGVGFKSYYVVWKRFEVSMYCSAISSLNRTMQYGNLPPAVVLLREVSCLNRTMQYGNEHQISEVKKMTKFKSYYVVWKLVCVSRNRKNFLCLNRTMQYGNFFHTSTLFSTQICLNRTMQYGNSAKWKKITNSQQV